MQYKVDVHTGDIPFAGTDSDIWLWFDGTAGRSGWLYMDNAEDNFERNDTVTFHYILPDLGPVTSAWVYFDPEGFAPGWFLDTVTINGSTFSHYNWLTSEGMVTLTGPATALMSDTSGDLQVDLIGAPDFNPGDVVVA